MIPINNTPQCKFPRTTVEFHINPHPNPSSQSQVLSKRQSHYKTPHNSTYPSPSHHRVKSHSSTAIPPPSPDTTATISITITLTTQHTTLRIPHKWTLNLPHTSLTSNGHKSVTQKFIPLVLTTIHFITLKKRDQTLQSLVSTLNATQPDALPPAFSSNVKLLK